MGRAIIKFLEPHQETERKFVKHNQDILSYYEFYNHIAYGRHGTNKETLKKYLTKKMESKCGGGK